MPITLTVNGTDYNYPVAGEDPGWGGDATDWAEAVTAVLSIIINPNDILDTSFSIANNTAVPTSINGLLFDPGSVRSANINYSVYRESDAIPSGTVESGIIYLDYDDNAAPGSKWILSQQTNGNAGMSFSILDSGQVQYMSTDITAPGYSGTMRFRAKTLGKN